MNDKNFIEELRQKREEYGVTQTSINIYYNQRNQPQKNVYGKRAGKTECRDGQYRDHK